MIDVYKQKWKFLIRTKNKYINYFTEVYFNDNNLLVYLHWGNE
jgi:hypothetical protein